MKGFPASRCNERVRGEAPRGGPAGWPFSPECPPPPSPPHAAVAEGAGMYKPCGAQNEAQRLANRDFPLYLGGCSQVGRQKKGSVVRLRFSRPGKPHDEVVGILYRGAVELWPAPPL